MLEIKGLRTAFVRYLEEHTGDPQPRVTARNALFAYYHDIGMPFAEILKDAGSMARAEVLLAEHFRKVRHADPETEAAAYHGCWIKFRAFLEATDQLDLLLAPPEADETQ